MNIELRDKCDRVLCEMTSGGVWQRLVKFNIDGLGFLPFVNVFGGWSINGYQGRFWRWLDSRVFVGGCGGV